MQSEAGWIPKKGKASKSTRFRAWKKPDFTGVSRIFFTKDMHLLVRDFPPVVVAGGRIFTTVTA
jgi:hypothetical protein